MPLIIVLGGTAAFFGSWAISALWGGYVLTVLWGWFMVPTFHLPALALAPAIGLAMVVGYLTIQIRPSKKGESFAEGLSTAFVMGLLKPLFALFFGWVVHLFM